MSESISDIFKIPTLDEWRQKIAADLKGKDISILTHHTRHGIPVDAVNYGKPDETIYPGVTPYVRGNKKQNGNFTSQIRLDTRVDSNETLLDLLSRNVQSIMLVGPFNAEFLKGVEPTYISIGRVGKPTLEGEFIRYMSQNKCDFFFDFDPLSNLTDTSGDTDFSQIAKLKKEYPNSYFLSVNANTIADSGGTIISELLYALLAGHDYLVGLMDAGLSIDEASSTIRFNISSGREFLLETAKLRAFRHMWSTVVNAYDPEHNCSLNAYITSSTAKWNKLVVDKETNILRATTELMAGILGGADTVEVDPLNLSQHDRAFNQRIALNLINLLREESYMDCVADPIGGSYSIEELTNEIKENVWNEFKTYESKGGLTDHLSSFRARIITEQKELTDLIASGDYVLVGANKYVPEGIEFDPKHDMKFIEL